MIFAVPAVFALFEVSVAVTAAVLLFAGCDKNKPAEDKPQDKKPPEDKPLSKTEPISNRPTDPEETVDFLEVAKDTYWHDLNLDGRQKDNETFFVPAGKDRMTEANRFLQSRRAYASPCYRLKPSFVPINRSEYLHHPEKNRIDRQLKQDMQELEAMNHRPEIYTKLLEDLKSISEELPHVVFRYPDPGEVPEGFIGTYNPLSNEMVVNQGAPISLLVHELDHRLTSHRRVSEWSLPYRVKCGPEDVRPVPKIPELPSPFPALTQFKFSLDFPGNGQNDFTYDDVDSWKPLYRSLELGAEACFTPESKASALANEVRGYLTMSRYLLFRIGFTEPDVAALRGEDPTKKTAAEQKLLLGLKRHLQGSNLNYRWANQLILHYLARGGSSRNNLSVFVKEYYTEMQAPGFTDTPDCKK